MKSKTYYISRTINASPERLFQVVSDFNNYDHWNTIIPQARGELVEGTELQLTMKVDKKFRPFNPRVVAVDRDKEFLLSKVFISQGIGELCHRFTFEPLADGQTRFTQTWTGKGFLVGLLWPKIKKGFADFEVFNNDLIRYIDRNNQVK